MVRTIEEHIYERDYAWKQLLQIWRGEYSYRWDVYKVTKTIEIEEKLGVLIHTLKWGMMTRGWNVIFYWVHGIECTSLIQEPIVDCLLKLN
jgi:hypothetical protein